MTEKKRVLIKEKLAPEGIKYLEDQGFEVDLGIDWTAEELVAAHRALPWAVIRSATKVTAEVIAARPTCKSSAAPAWASTMSMSKQRPSAVSSSSTRRQATCSPPPSTRSP